MGALCSIELKSPLCQAHCEMGFEVKGHNLHHSSALMGSITLIKLFNFCVQFSCGKMEIITLTL